MLIVIFGGSSLETDFDQEAIAPRVVLLTPRPAMGSRTEVEMMLMKLLLITQA